MQPKLSTKLFAGPSLTTEAVHLIAATNIELHPPVKRGDFQALIKEGFLGNLIIVDGYFKQLLAIGHYEIRQTLEKGCTVYGLSSMGAIRAYEMESLGMIGFGAVFNWFKQEEDFQDDEVSLLHGPAPDYSTFSEPLVHFRTCVAHLIAEKKLNLEKGNSIIQQLKSLYYGDRTMDLFCQLLQKETAINPDFIRTNFSKYQIKQLDVIDFLQQKIWEN